MRCVYGFLPPAILPNMRDTRFLFPNLCEVGDSAQPCKVGIEESVTDQEPAPRRRSCRNPRRLGRGWFAACRPSRLRPGQDIQGRESTVEGERGKGGLGPLSTPGGGVLESRSSGRLPEQGKESLKWQLMAEALHWLEHRPDLKLAAVADSTKNRSRTCREEASAPPPVVPTSQLDQAFPSSRTIFPTRNGLPNRKMLL